MHRFAILQKDRKMSKKFYVAPIIAILFSYWIGMADVLGNIESSSDKLSKFSNWIQLLVNGFSFSVILICSIVNSFSDILLGFIKFDAKMSGMCETAPTEKCKVISSLNMIFCSLFLAYKGCFEIYVLIIRYEIIGPVYWLVSFAPSIVQTVALYIVISTLIAFYIRLKLVQNILMDEKVSKKFITAIPINERKNFKLSSFIEKTKIPSVFYAFNSLWDLGKLIEKFFGPIFLSSIASIFVVTTVQIYYCYVLFASSQIESNGYSVWTLLVSLNEIIWNSLTIIYLTTLCEMITDQVSLEANHYLFSQRFSREKIAVM